MQTRQCGGISAAYLYATSPHMFSGGTETAFARVRDQVRFSTNSFLDHEAQSKGFVSQ